MVGTLRCKLIGSVISSKKLIHTFILKACHSGSVLGMLSLELISIRIYFLVHLDLPFDVRLFKDLIFIFIRLINLSYIVFCSRSLEK
jgi:hypothetical protein